MTHLKRSAARLVVVFFCCIMLFVNAKSAFAANANVQKAQQVLIELGYQPGPADGLFGKKTMEALKKYQKDNNLPITGQIDEATAQALGVSQYVPAKSEKSERSTLTFTLKNGEVQVGGISYMVPSYGASGKSYGSSGIMLSTSTINSKLDLNGIPAHVDPYSIKLGYQLDSQKQAEVLTFLRRKLCTTGYASIDTDGIVYPDNITTVHTSGPFLLLEFDSPKKNQLSMQGLTVTITTTKGRKLKTKPSTDNRLVVLDVPKEPLTVKVTSSAAQWEGVLNPVFRGSTEQLVMAVVFNVSVGKEIGESN